MADRSWHSEPSDPIADLRRETKPEPPLLLLSPAALVNLEVLLGVEAAFDGPTPPAVLAERARRSR